MTDSTMVSTQGWYDYILQKIGDQDMKIKHELIDVMSIVDVDEFGDLIDDDGNEVPLVKPYELVDDELEYTFYDDELIELKKSVNPMKLVPQEGFRYSVINIIAYVLGKVINDYMVRFTMNAQSYREDKKCLLYMKNEFLFKRILLTGVKKNYASIQELQEGHIVPKKAGMDIKGLAMMKSGTNKRTQKILKQIMYEDILNAGDQIDYMKVLKDLATFEHKMINDIRSGSKELFKPKKLKNIRNYDDPYRISGIKESIVWNAVKDDGVEGIDLEEENHVDLIKTIITPANIEDMKDRFPDTYEKFKKIMEKPEFSELIKGICLPKDVPTPEWVMDYIDYTSILNDNLHLFPLEPLGIYRANNNNNITNVLSL